MSKKKDKKARKRRLKSPLKAVTTAALIVGGSLFSTPSAAKATEAGTHPDSIESRVNTVRSALQKKLSNPDQSDTKFSYSELELAQWGNWGNWGNWNNWANWANWNNWNNWRNWGNWGNR
jgi:hypothetical protein